MTKIWSEKSKNWAAMKVNVFSEKPEFKDAAEKILQHYLANVLEHSCLAGVEFDTVSFDISFCDNEKMHEINREYRDKDKPADVITFALFADAEPKLVLDGGVNLGEIIINLDECMKVLGNLTSDTGPLRSARSSVQTSQDLHTIFLISHGIMHLLGFDHQTETDYNFVVGLQKEAVETL